MMRLHKYRREKVESSETNKNVRTIILSFHTATVTTGVSEITAAVPKHSIYTINYTFIWKKWVLIFFVNHYRNQNL